MNLENSENIKRNATRLIRLSYGKTFLDRKHNAIKIIYKIILPSCGSECDIDWWEQIVKEIIDREEFEIKGSL